MKKTTVFIALLVVLTIIGFVILSADLPFKGQTIRPSITEIGYFEIGLPLGLRAARQHGIWVCGSRSLVLVEDGQATVHLQLAAEADDLALMPNGVMFAIHGDVFGVVLGQEPFEPMLNLPSSDMRIASGNSGRVFIFGLSDPHTNLWSIYDLQGSNSVVTLTRLIDFREKVVDVEVDDEILWIATERMIYKFQGGRLEPFFAETMPLQATGISNSAEGSLMVSTSRGLLEIAMDGSGVWWYTGNSFTDVATSGSSLFLLKTESDRALVYEFVSN